MQQPKNFSPLSSSLEGDSSKSNSNSNNGSGGGGGAEAGTPQKNQKNQRQLPTPQELVAHYESQGMETQEASFKVIDDLQKMMIRVIASERGKKDKNISDFSRKLDAANSRLAILESKLDSKPGYLPSLGIGVISTAAWPHIAAGAAQIWTSVRRATTRPD